MSIENGLVMRAVGDTMIISPPLVATSTHIDELIERAKKSLDAALERIPTLDFNE
jgi:putrescine aminotransferase